MCNASKGERRRRWSYIEGTVSFRKRQFIADDLTLKVYGTKNLRVVDVSIIPLIVSSPLQATAYAIAEQGSSIYSLYDGVCTDYLK